MSEIIYHGSEYIIEKPEFGKGALNNDYGRGFYCTKSVELAKEWACARGNDGFANCYLMDYKSLKTLDLNAEPYNILNWLAVLAKNRTYWQKSSISFEAKKYLQENFFVDISEYDIVKGYRADDSYFTFAQDFVSGTISYQKLKRAMHLGELGEQIVLISPKAFSSISFMGYEEAPGKIYGIKKEDRDRRARLEYRNEKINKSGINDLYMIDIMRENIKNGDPRL